MYPCSYSHIFNHNWCPAELTGTLKPQSVFWEAWSSTVDISTYHAQNNTTKL